MAAQDPEKILKELEKALDIEEKVLEEYNKWVIKMKKDDYTDLAWDVAWEQLYNQEERVRTLTLEYIDVSTHLYD